MPFALIAIAALALVTLAGYRAVSSAAGVMTALQDETEVKRALASAEAEATFVFLTSPPVSQGIFTAAAAPPNISAFDTIDAEDFSPAEHWRANGEARRAVTVSTQTTATYFDAGGFAPFAAINEDQVAEILTRAGFDRDNAEMFAARIGDYQDPDVRRRFRGAERPEYRLFGKPPPTGSPLRSVAELSSVLQFSEQATPQIWDYLSEYGRFLNFGGEIKLTMAPDELAALLDTDNAGLGQLGVESRSPQPSDTARFLLETQASGGLTRRRAVEIMRTPSAADKPFRRFWVYDKAGGHDRSSIETADPNGLALIFEPETDSGAR